ncbi:MAG: V-type ATP synthase subunit A [Gammaproteobacteria bacterium]|nr:V-type ATP synthase subunit A [Gammaproteobacteria bacterium]MDH4313223.1 V-type ATP synthase subunit A [Gammaproteobacteria bacterium]MDH5213571.1 V-type ATP synthase subunit A [Gammaproteobacteria bacterium]
MTEATIRWISGPVMRARSTGRFHLSEAVLVGERELPGEIIRVDTEGIVAQIYEDTTGLKPGDRVSGTGQRLSIRLRPGLLGNIFDGLLRSLTDMPGDTVRPGTRSAEAAMLKFLPTLRPGDQLAPGMAFGDFDKGHIAEKFLPPPGISGTVRSIVAAGEYRDDETLCVIEDADGVEIPLSAGHAWPVRVPRPVRRRLPPGEPLVTGQRIMDTLFPLARGGRAALPGGFGTGKTILQESLAKWCDADVIVYVGCGERGNEMAEVLNEFPTLEDPRSGRPLLDRTVIIANTSNMPVAAREASIYTGITLAEYFRDQGLHVALMADSTTRWAEALREISGRLGELPGEYGFPAYLSSRLAEFYERAAHVETLAGGQGSVTIIGAVSPPAGDFSEPVTTQSKRYVRCFWALDRDRAQARFFPAIHPLTSYSEDVDALAHWWQSKGNPDWTSHRRQILTLLEQRARLERMARIVGKDALPPKQQLTLLCADLVNESLLRQSAFSIVDRFCSPERQTALLRAILHFVHRAEQSLEGGIALADIAAMPVLRQLQRASEEIPDDKLERFRMLMRRQDDEFDQLARGHAHAR